MLKWPSQLTFVIFPHPDLDNSPLHPFKTRKQDKRATKKNIFCNVFNLKENLWVFFERFLKLKPSGQTRKTYNTL